MGLPAAFNDAPSRNFQAATEHDTNALPSCRGVVCLTSGNCVVDNWGDVELTFPMTAGQWLPISPKRLKVASTGTYALLR